MYKKKYLVTFDLDSTIADTGHRHHMIDRENGTDWNAYSLACVDDEPVAGLVTLVNLLSNIKDIEVHALSARNNVAQQATIDWLEKHGIPIEKVWLDTGVSVEYSAEYTHAMYKYARLQEVEAETGLKCILHVDDYAEVCVEFAKHGVPVVCVRTPQEIEELAETKAAGLR